MSAQQLISHYDKDAYDATLRELYKTISSETSLIQRVHAFSGAFLNIPYLQGALGEGPSGKFDQNPTYRTDYFDCLTYVITVSALVFSKDFSEFKKNICSIHYFDGKVNYHYRHHFMEVDLNLNSLWQNWVEDVTVDIVDSEENPIAKVAETLIERRRFFAYKKMNSLKLLEPVPSTQAENLLTELQKPTGDFPDKASRLAYLPLTTLFDQNGRNREAYLSQIPDGSVIEIVRPNWQLRDEIGSNLNISHLGFAIRRDNQLFFRHASILAEQVVDELFVDYLSRYLQSSTIKGINVQRMRVEN